MTNKRIPNKSGYLLATGILAVTSLLAICCRSTTQRESPEMTGYHHLMSAISSRHPVEVETILKSGVNPDIYPNTIEDCREEIDITPLNSAAEDGSTEIVRMLLDHGADPNKGDGWHVGGPLSAATRKDSLATMALLLKRGASLNEYGGTGAAIWRAAMDGKVRSVRFLLDHGATTTPEFLKLLRETQGSPEIISMIEKWLERHP